MSEEFDQQESQQDTVYNAVMDMKELMSSLRFFISSHGRDIEKIRRDVAGLTVQLSSVKKMLTKQDETLDEVLRRVPSRV